MDFRFQYFCPGWHVKPKNTYTKAECNRFFVHFEVLANLIRGGVPENVYKRTVCQRFVLLAAAAAAKLFNVF